MPTDRKSESARANGAKSRGPKTPEGKARSSRNALRHGLTAEFDLLDNESEKHFESFLDAYVDRYQPADAVEMEQVHTIAVSLWRLRRIRNIESGLLRTEVLGTEEDVDELWSAIDQGDRLALAFRGLAENSSALALLMRYEASLCRMHDRAVKQLEALQQSRLPNEPTKPLSPRPKPTSRGRKHPPRQPVPESGDVNRDLPEPEPPQWENAA